MSNVYSIDSKIEKKVVLTAQGGLVGTGLERDKAVLVMENLNRVSAEGQNKITLYLNLLEARQLQQNLARVISNLEKQIGNHSKKGE